MEYGGARFLSGTRGQLVALLRRDERTVDELAREIGITQNAVRGHLMSLERDGLVRRSGARRTAGKTTGTYQLTPEAERLFPTACGPALTAVLETIAERMAPRDVGSLLRRTGRRLAADGGPLPDGPEAGLARVALPWGGSCCARRSCRYSSPSRPRSGAPSPRWAPR